jgi:hypothetical protein
MAARSLCCFDKLSMIQQAPQRCHPEPVEGWDVPREDVVKALLSRPL